MYIVEYKRFEDFSEKEQKQWCQSDNGCGKKDATYLVITVDGKLLQVESSAMEPEDKEFYRDLSWIKESLERAFLLGLKKGRSIKSFRR